MAYTCPQDLDGFLPHLGKPDTKFRQTLGGDLLNYLADPTNSIACQDIGHFVDGLIPWMQSSNYKVSSNGIEVMTFLADRLGTDFRPYLSTVLPAVVDRLGDAKDTVREKAQLLILKLLERSVLTPQQLLEKLTPFFTHKNAKIREEILRCLVNILNEHGSQSITLNRFIPSIVKLLSDPTATVRDIAFSTIVELYKHIGERLRIDLQRKNIVPAAKLPALIARFDEVKENGELLQSAIASDLARDIDEIDRIAMPKPAVPVKRIPTMNSGKRMPSAPARSGPTLTSSNSMSALSRVGSMRLTSKNGKDAGAVDEDTFVRAFEDVPTVQIFSNRELNEQMNQIKDIISDPNKDWNKRVDAIKKLRSLLIAGATSYEDFYVLLRNLEIPLQTTIKDLRSQVVREACLTISYYSQQLGHKFDHTAEMLLPLIINLIQNSAKIISSAGITCMKIIIQYTQAPRLIPILIQNQINHKSKEIRRYCCDFIEQALTLWSTHSLEKYMMNLSESIKKGVADADPEARVSSRKAFRAYKEHFPDQAEILLQSLDPNYRRALHGELCLSSSSSSGSLAQPTSLSSGLRTPRTPYRPTQSHGSASVTDASKRGGFRSNSAIDLQAAQRAKARAQYAAMSRQKITSGTASLQGEVAQQARPRKSPEVNTMMSPERTGRTRTRTSGVSQSQPTSRSGSPSSRLSYATYGRLDHESPRPRRMSSGIPRSTANSRDGSRETSPSRSHSKILGRSRPPISPATRPVMAQRILQQSLEAESALADALNFDSMDSGDFNNRIGSARKLMRSLDNHSDDSETSSVCSERSFDSFRRPSEDIHEIIGCCASTTWQERKEGLVSLQHYLSNNNVLTRSDIKKITEIFTKMFMDPHTKVLSLFLDTLNELIMKHHNDLHEWLYVLLQRIFNKLGTDLLSSLNKKIQKTLDVIKLSFPAELQLTCLYRFLLDNTQTPNTKVKVAVLSYLRKLAKDTDPSQFSNDQQASQALQKVITLTQDQKSVEIRNAARSCIISLFDHHTAKVTYMLSELPKNYEDIANKIVTTHMKKTSGSEPGSPIVGGSPNTLSPQGQHPRNHDDINQEDFYRSLRRTTAEIQNYSFEALGISKLERDRDTTSQDSGISQMSTGANDNNKVEIATTGLEEKMEELHLRPTLASKPNNYNKQNSLPYTVNGISEGDNSISIDDIDEDDMLRKIKSIETSAMSEKDKREILVQLYLMIKKRRVEFLTQLENFKLLLRILLELLEKSDYKTQIVVLLILTEIFNCKELRSCYLGFVELLIVKILNAHKTDRHKDVVRHAEACAAAMAVCPFDLVANILDSVIKTDMYPRNQAAIKMLTKLVEHHSSEITDKHLEMLMPGLIQAYDHEESPVRKCAVFCMVAIHSAVGEDRLKPYLASLVGSKLKLLHLYVKRAQQSSSVPTSPKNSAS